jgi:YD repeat-containing protein
MSRFAKRFGSISLAIIAICTAGVAAGYQTTAAPARPITSNEHQNRSFAQQTQAPQGPTLGQVQSEEAQMSWPGPATVFVEDLPRYPVPAAADPYTTTAPSQNQRMFHHSARLTLPSLRTRPRLIVKQNAVTVGGANVTGINGWWGFTSGGIAGLGKYLVNVATGNLLIQSTDMTVPHRGASLSFARTYNSFSQHDWNNSDGSVVNNYGDGWTNSFDMHVAYNNLSNGSGVSVFDANGARYDYEQDCNSSCVYNINSPLGQYAMLTKSTNLISHVTVYYWTTKTGLVYMFHDPNDNTGVAGRLSKIWSRNNNVQFTFTYSFDSGASPAPTTLNTVAIASDTTNGNGQTVQLSFSNVSTSSGTRRLLGTLTWPDSTTVAYKYDTSGRVVEVDEPTNNTTNPSLPQLYQYSSSGYLVTQANGARWSLDSALGGITKFVYAGSAVSVVKSYGYINPTVNDDSGNGPIQSGVSGMYGVSSPYRQTYFANSSVSPTPSPAPSQSPTGTAACTSSGSTAVYDTDGHDRVFCWDSSNRVVQTAQWTGSIWLTTLNTWDSNNDLISSKDPRSKETDLAYDTRGNLIAEALPAASPGVGATRPTSLYTYDASNNLVASCDPTWADKNGFDWTASPGPTYSPCPSNNANSPTNPGPTLATYAPSSPEPFGELVAVTKPLGYVVATSYSPGPQAGTLDYGQPTEIKGASISQGDGTSITPTTDLYYDNYGNVICAATRGGVDYPSPTWNTAIKVYTGNGGKDALMGRLTQSADADDASLSNGNSNGACPKTAGISGSTIVSAYTYFANGQVETSQSPVERAASVSTSFGYDADGDQTVETRHFGLGGSPDSVTRVYDADARLVEVINPGSPINIGWDTRYDYDLSQNGSNTNPVSLTAGGSLHAYGGLFKTQELESGTWTDLNGTAYDPAGRVEYKYTYTPNINCTSSNYATCEAASVTQNSYDGAPGPGLLATSTDAVGIESQLTYDDIGRVTKVAFSDLTPGSATTYDLDGHVLSISSTCSNCSGDTESYQYDREGKPTQVSESPVQNSDPTILNYSYYLNGTREYISAVPKTSPSPGAMNQTNLLTFNYFADGRISNKAFAYSSPNPMTAPFSYTYTRAGRPITQTDTYQSTTSLYDTSAGRLSSIAYPEGTETFSTFDPEGEQLSFIEPGQASADTQNFDGNAELIQQNAPSNINSNCYPEPLGFTANSLNAFMITYSWVGGGDGCTDSVIDGTEDVRSGVAVSIPSSCQIAGNQYQCQPPATFDADGRLTGIPFKQQTNSPNFYDEYRSYDALSHLTEQTDNLSNIQMERNYSPSGRIRQIATADANHALHWETLHWDGNTILFTTSAVGQVDDVKIGASADYFPTDPNSQAQLTVWDRDYTGHMRGCHNGGSHGGVSTWYAIDSYDAGSGGPLPEIGGFCVAPAMYGKAIGQGGAVLQPNGDGYWDGYVIFQGVRDFDQKIRGWIEPDPVSGSDREPMTLKRYTWNNNNPSSFSDSSGKKPVGGDNPDYDPSNPDNISGWFTGDSGAQDAAIAGLIIATNAAEELTSNFPTELAYVINAGDTYNQASADCKCEWGGEGYTSTVDGKTVYNYTASTDHEPRDVTVNKILIPVGAQFSSFWHTHPDVTIITQSGAITTISKTAGPWSLSSDKSHMKMVDAGETLYTIYGNGDVWVQGPWARDIPSYNSYDLDNNPYRAVDVCPGCVTPVH